MEREKIYLFFPFFYLGGFVSVYMKIFSLSIYLLLSV